MELGGLSFYKNKRGGGGVVEVGARSVLGRGGGKGMGSSF